MRRRGSHVRWASAPRKFVALSALMLALVILLVGTTSAFADGLKTRYEQDDSRITYTGSWSTLAKTFLSGGTYAFTNSAGRAVVKFSGTDVAYVTNKDNMYGIAKMTLDGGTPTFVDLYSYVRNVAQSTVWSASGLPNTTHVLVIEWTGLKNVASTASYVGVDAIDVTGTLQQAVMVTTPSAGPNGSISPATAQTTAYAAKGPSFTIAANAHYHIADVTVDGTSVGAVGSYAFGTLTADHAISASFAPNTYAITASAGSHGSISPAGVSTVTYGDGLGFTIAPDVGYQVADVTVDGTSVGAVTSYAFSGVAASHTIAATFSLTSLPITVSAGAGGSVSPSTQSVLYGSSSPTFTITPSGGYHVADVLVDGHSVGAVSAYAFQNVTAGHTIAASFALNAVQRYEQTDPMVSYDGTWFTLARVFHSGGSYCYTDTAGGKAIIRFHGTSIDYITNKDNMYGIVKITLDGGTPAFVDLYSYVRNISQSDVWSARDLSNTDHSLLIEWTGLKNPASIDTCIGLDAFDINGALIPSTQTITLDAGTGGSVSPSTATTVNYSDPSPLYTFTAGAHHHLADVTVDGTSVGTPSSYQFASVTGDHTLGVRFALDTYKVSASAGSHGSISPSGDTAVEYGNDQGYTITPDTGYHVADVTVDGQSVGALDSYTFSGVKATHTISATFAINTYAVKPDSGEHGSVSPSVAQMVDYGSGASFDFTPDAHYHVADVRVDGVGVDTANEYDFTNVTADHTLHVAFAIDTNDIFASAGSGGSISPAGSTAVDYGSDQGYTIAPDTGYHIADVKVDGESVGAVSSYSFTGVTTPRTISATFAIDTFAVTSSAGAHGAISPLGSTSVDYGSDQAFTITPDAHYHVADVLVDGVSVGAVTSYTFADVAATHSISASFAINTSNIVASAGASGTISPAGTTAVNYGSDQSYTIAPSDGSHVADVQVDGVSVGAVSTYTFSGVTTGHTISATFAINTFTITPSAGVGGSVSPAVAQTVNYGASKTFTFTPSSGYFVADVMIDGADYGVLSSYTFTNVTASHAINVTFGQLSGRFEQTDSRISYSGTGWTTIVKSFHSGGSYAATRNNGDIATVKFNGTSINYITNEDNMYGIVKVTLDGGTPSYIDLYSATRNIAQGIVWRSGTLAYGTHTLVIQCVNQKNPASTGYWVGLDAVDVLGTLVQAP